ncbi:MAG: hypothetical protein H0W90_14290 [Actinobacteria bacterium]|nr:hypothetical protein [Actinomycetota bacterium]
MTIDIAGVVRCGCGYVIWGEEEDDLPLDADLHVRSAHPDLVAPFLLSSWRARQRRTKQRPEPSSGARRAAM